MLIGIILSPIPKPLPLTPPTQPICTGLRQTVELTVRVGRTLYDINQSKILFDPPPREMEIKTQINKWDLMKLKSFCTAKETINKTKRQPSERETIFENEATDRGLIPKIYKQLMKLNITITTT